MKNRFEVLLSEETQKFIESLEPKIQKKIGYNINKVRKKNNIKLLKKLNENIWEFRTRYDKHQIRLLAFWDINKKALIICSHGFIKKTKKTPRIEIRKAEEFRKKYLKM